MLIQKDEKRSVHKFKRLVIDLPIFSRFILFQVKQFGYKKVQFGTDGDDFVKDNVTVLLSR